MNAQSASTARAARSHAGAVLKAGLAAVVALASPAHASLVGQQILGSLKFQGDSKDYFDPANGLVPAGYGNVTGPLVTVAGLGHSFGFEDVAILDGSNFSNFSGADSFLDLATRSMGPGLKSWEQTFTSVAPGLFNTLTLVSNSYSGLTYSLVGDTITLDWGGSPGGPSIAYDARFIVHRDAEVPPPPGVPEPASWALMILGFGGIGAALRRRRRWALPASARATRCSPILPSAQNWEIP